MEVVFTFVLQNVKRAAGRSISVVINAEKSRLFEKYTLFVILTLNNTCNVSNHINTYAST